MTVDILLPVLDADGKRTFDETLPAKPLGADRYRLLGSPGLVEGIAAGDELELHPAEPSGFRVLRRGGQLCVWVYVSEPLLAGTEERLARRPKPSAATWMAGIPSCGSSRCR